MQEVNILFPDKRVEKMLLHSIKETADLVKALRKRHTIRVDDPQLDVEDYFAEGYVSFSDAISGEHIVSVMW